MVLNLIVVIKKYILLSLNLSGKFRKHWSVIFEPSINIEGSKFSINLFDKRNIFPFSIVRMPHLTSNILYNTFYMFYAAFGAEILRIDWMASNELISWITVQHLIVEWITKQEMSSPFPRLYPKHLAGTSKLLESNNRIYGTHLHLK